MVSMMLRRLLKGASYQGCARQGTVTQRETAGAGCDLAFSVGTLAAAAAPYTAHASAGRV
jgi:hypothetical protein